MTSNQVLTPPKKKKKKKALSSSQETRMSKQVRTQTHISSIHLCLRRASSAKLHNSDRLPNASAPRGNCHSGASLLLFSGQAPSNHPLRLTPISYPLYSAILLTHILPHILNESLYDVCVHSREGPDCVVDRKIVLICPKTRAQYSPHTKTNNK